MPKKPRQPPPDPLVPPSRVRERAPEQPPGVWFSLNLQDYVAALATKLRERDPETLAKLGLSPESEPPPSTGGPGK